MKQRFPWNSLAFSMIQQMLATWSLVPLPFLNPDCTYGSSQFISLIAQLVKNPPSMQERFDSWVRKIPWIRDRLPTPVFLGFPGGSAGEESAFSVRDLGWEDPRQKGKATPSSILAWRIPWTVQRVRYNWATFIFTFREKSDKNKGKTEYRLR